MIPRFGRYLLRRAAAAVLFILVVSSSALVLTRLAPGDVAGCLGLRPGDAAQLQRIRLEQHLDQPTWQVLGGWLGGLMHFDLGTSFINNRPVTRLLAERAPNTALLAFVSLSAAMLVAVPLGLLTGARPRGLLARLVGPISLALVACPPIVGALALLWLALTTRWLSTAPGTLAVPVLALALPLGAMIERLQSQAIADTLAAPDLVAAAARGVPRSRLLWVHAARQSVRPVLGIFGIVIGSLFSGSLAVEWATSWPGLARLFQEAVVCRDVYVVAGCALAGAALIALGNLVADLLRALVDPRVREQW